MVTPTARVTATIMAHGYGAIALSVAGVHYVEKIRENRGLQAFLSGVSAAVVGVIAVVSLDLVPGALVDWVTVAISAAAFLLIGLLKQDVALVAVAAMIGGIIYAGIKQIV